MKTQVMWLAEHHRHGLHKEGHAPVADREEGNKIPQSHFLPQPNQPSP